MIKAKWGFVLASLLVSFQLFAQKRTLYIGPERVSCTGVAPISCLQYKDSLGQRQWNYWYDSIAAFKHVPGTEYVIEVIGVDVKRVPADASTKKWMLKKIVHMKKVDNNAGYKFLWMMSKGEKISLAGTKAFLQINEAEGRINGKGTCNNFFGKATWQAAEKNKGTVIFGPLGSTMMACADMQKETALFAVLETVNGYEFVGNKLLLKQNDTTVIELIQ
jgi:heat shock protein HslJ